MNGKDDDGFSLFDRFRGHDRGAYYPPKPSKTSVINIKSGQPYDVYIGRRNGRYKLPASIWGNPFKVGRDGTGEEVLEKYRNHVLNSPELMHNLYKLRGKTMGCWCKPGPCHGDVLMEILEEGVEPAQH